MSSSKSIGPYNNDSILHHPAEELSGKFLSHHVTYDLEEEFKIINIKTIVLASIIFLAVTVTVGTTIKSIKVNEAELKGVVALTAGIAAGVFSGLIYRGYAKGSFYQKESEKLEDQIRFEKSKYIEDFPLDVDPEQQQKTRQELDQREQDLKQFLSEDFELEKVNFEEDSDILPQGNYKEVSSKEIQRLIDQANPEELEKYLEEVVYPQDNTESSSYSRMQILLPLFQYALQKKPVNFEILKHLAFSTPKCPSRTPGFPFENQDKYDSIERQLNSIKKILELRRDSEQEIDAREKIETDLVSIELINSHLFRDTTLWNEGNRRALLSQAISGLESYPPNLDFAMELPPYTSNQNDVRYVYYPPDVVALFEQLRKKMLEKMHTYPAIKPTFDKLFPSQ